jgi:hypothetical protein
MNLYQPTITGSLSVSGSINISGSINVVGGGGTITGTASYASNAELLDGLDSTVFTLTSSFAAQTASFTAFTASILSYTASQNILNGTYTLTSSFAAQTASFTAFTSSVNTFTASINSFSASVLSYTSSLNAKTSSFATTGSNTFEGIQTINSNLIVTGSITAQTLVVQTITSSVDFVTGSTRFGSLLDNTHVFTGSMSVSGSITSQGGFILGNSATIAPTGSIGYNNAVGVFVYGKSGSEADFRLYNAGGLTAMSVVAGTQNISFNSSVAIGTTNLSARLNVQASANFENATLGTATGTMGYLSANGLYGMYVGIGNSGNTWLQSQRNDGTTAVYNLLLNPQGGNVGIGTSSPSGKLMLYQSSAGNVTQNIVSNQGGSTQVGINLSPSMTDGEIASNPAQASIYATDSNYGANIIFANKATGAVGNALTERMRIASTGNITCTNNSIKRATLTKLVSVGASSTSNMSFNTVNELGVPAAGYIMVEISAIGYGGAGSNGLIYKAIVGGYSGHTLNPNYHKYSEYVSAITNGSVSIYNPSYDVYGITVTNSASSQAMNIIFRLDVTW